MNPDYYKAFGLKRDPFNVTPDPSFLYLSPSHREALAQLEYGIKARRGFVMLSGEVGTGKTTLIHALLKELNGSAHTAFVYHTIVSPKDLLRYICEDFGILQDGQAAGDLPLDKLGTASKRGEPVELQDYLVLLNRFLLESYSRGENVALIIDEAQNLTPEVLESIRLLSNFETSQDKLLQILLVGQPELRDKLDLPELRAIRERLQVSRVLVPLNGGETREYIAQRLRRAGGDFSPISTNGLEAIYRYSGGVPRLINILCARGMIRAHGSGKRIVDATMIREVAGELGLEVPPKKKLPPVIEDRKGRREREIPKGGTAKPALSGRTRPKISHHPIAALTVAVVVGGVGITFLLDSTGIIGYSTKSAPSGAAREEVRGGSLAAGVARAEPAAREAKFHPAEGAAGGDVEYTVQAGDSLSRLAERFYGAPYLWQKIYQANTSSVKSPNHILVGQKIVIPSP